ncbi:alpha-ketoglutarate-dependent dioxygenase AlkB [Halobacteriovorax sp. GB3]|uniref:alpha-ketoglutarate-dependent dioxygenase AlkB family protein n=1 Tax=Halobacteriovorax sp. GB3 TaxID=2719615 RepID=UPI002360E109|nr:alpha-ketoglutarate-dependent dioxygenase AlkB [Halobacteriovorax sp. GB3]MDD0853476.1 alpha-ketoglutarate-dependent dioxygenase AlkB [Halobacteriovorax sp. GB3]
MIDLFLSEDYKIVLDRDGEVRYYPHFLEDDYFDLLNSQIEWRQDQITLYGKTHDVPRLQAWYGDEGVEYGYSNIPLSPKPWTKSLLEIKSLVEQKTGHHFNGCLCNLYRTGRDYASWHSDDEPELGRNPVIASVSLGDTRKFVLKHKTNKGIEKVEIELEDKSLLLMLGSLQHHWKHQLNKTQKAVGPRINLTFRKVIS